jgi:hypothetical protein
MSDTSADLDPWKLVWGQPYVDSEALASAIEHDLQKSAQPDFHTRLLVRDSAVAIHSHWGQRRFARWLAVSPVGVLISAILREDLGHTGFPAIRSRLVDSVDAITLKRIFELLGREIHAPVEVHIAGSIPTLIKGLTAHPTGDIDFVDEVSEEIRRQRAVLRKIEREFGLKLGHVQSHDLPAHWQDRRQWLGDFGRLRVYVVDEYDIFVSKVSSKLEKHKSDLGVLALKLNKEVARHRLLTDGRAFLNDPKLRRQIEQNWGFIFQEPLVVDRPEKRASSGGGAAPEAKAAGPNRGRPRRPRKK